MIKVAFNLVVSFMEYIKGLAFFQEAAVQNVNFNGKAGVFIEAKFLYFFLFIVVFCLGVVLYRVIKKECGNLKISLL